MYELRLSRGGLYTLLAGWLLDLVFAFACLRYLGRPAAIAFGILFVIGLLVALRLTARFLLPPLPHKEPEVR